MDKGVDEIEGGQRLHRKVCFGQYVHLTASDVPKAPFVRPEPLELLDQRDVVLDIDVLC